MEIVFALYIVLTDGFFKLGTAMDRIETYQTNDECILASRQLEDRKYEGLKVRYICLPVPKK